MTRRKRLETFRSTIWALCAAAVVLFVFFAAIGGIDPAEAWVATVVVAVLGVLWLVHALYSRRLGPPERMHLDRERRGF